LDVTMTGGTGTDFSATFEPLDNGQSLRLTRRIVDDTLRQPIVIQSVYRRTSDTADWNVYDSRSATASSRQRSGYEAEAVVPEGMTLVATLDQSINMRSARENDRVTLTVRNAPRADLEGAVIAGYIT